MRADAWSALGTCVGALVAVAAASFAAWQVWELRSTRERQTQPNVVAFTNPNAKVYQFLDLSVAMKKSPLVAKWRSPLVAR